MSSFDDEFGLFGDESEEADRRPTLGARRIASGETVIDEVEPEDDRPKRTVGGGKPEGKPRTSGGRGGYGGGGGGGRRGGGGYERRNTQPADPWASQRRASELLDFIAKKLVQKPEAASVELFQDEEGKPVIELIVDSEDLGKVIGRNGRVAQALRTLVRATAEGRVSVDILDKEEAESFDEGQDDAE